MGSTVEEDTSVYSGFDQSVRVIHLYVFELDAASRYIRWSRIKIRQRCTGPIFYRIDYSLYFCPMVSGSFLKTYILKKREEPLIESYMHGQLFVA